MRTDPRAEDVREIVREVFEQLKSKADDWDIGPTPWFDMEETIRIGEGRCTCRCYAIDGLSAEWLVAEGVVEFYDHKGKLVRRVNLLKKVLPQRIAA
jgi:hypothetical protein